MNQVLTYFNQEKVEGLVFIVVGVIALTLAAYFTVKVKQPFYNGLAYSLVFLALIQVTVGTIIYLRSPKDIIRVTRMLETEKKLILKEEIPRMEKVMKSFVIYRYIEMTLILTGMIFFVVSSPGTLWKGVGMGLVIQASLMLLLDYFAEKRGHTYLDYLHTITS